MTKLRDVDRIISVTTFADVYTGQMSDKVAPDDVCCKVQVVSSQLVRCAERLELNIVTEADPLFYQFENIWLFDIVQLILE